MKTVLYAAAVLTLSAGSALAGPSTIWSVNVAATGSGVSSPAYAERFTLDGAKVGQVLLGTGFSPGGIALVGNTAYVSSTTDGLIRSFNTLTGIVSGTTIATGQPGYGSLSADATGLWANDYGGGNKAYHITFAGVIDRNVSLSLCSSYCNGLEVVSRGGLTFFVANRGETEALATYDRYTTTGGVVTAGLLSNVPNGSGIAYSSDLDRYFVANGFDNALTSYSAATGGLLGSIALGGTAPDSGFGNVRFIADVAFQVPEPATIALMLTGFGVMGMLRRRI